MAARRFCLSESGAKKLQRSNLKVGHGDACEQCERLQKFFFILKMYLIFQIRNLFIQIQ